MADHQRGLLGNDRCGRILPFSKGVLNVRKVPQSRVRFRQTATNMGRPDADLGMSVYANTCRSSPFEMAVYANIGAVVWLMPARWRLPSVHGNFHAKPSGKAGAVRF